ncbi:RHS repeat-associated core domain-containing protein [Lysobacter yananisis]|uniref:RHS repeat-associated core domain-containing protein n=1 Tax=Lysobacter yananisis TaxID=1003114 RepID=A0ABY9PBX6_9GAMM|nr:RHS repeat-associated core domain-containing protein [Lysobacter yananisis]WMT03550.1 RHS repeat-associated core domain-containing protein [Lysobacter yananisis]
MNYAYNGLGQQARRYNDTSIRHSLYAEDGSWLGEYDNAGAALQQVVWMDELPVGVIEGSATAQKLYYIEPDHLGTPRIVVDPTRNKAVWTWSVKGEAFGSTMPNEDPDMDGTKFVFDMRFPGQRFDAASGLVYNYFRDYDSTTGRYIQGDPTGLDGGISLYAYAQSGPLKYYDPEGLCPCGNVDALLKNARADMRDWSRKADRSEVNSSFGAETNKCNLFVDTIYEESGYALPNLGGSLFSVMMLRYPPGAQTLSDASYDLLGWPKVSGPAQPGDLVAYEGHVGIYAGDGTTISASTDKGKVENSWGFRKGQNPVIRRSKCP